MRRTRIVQNRRAITTLELLVASTLLIGMLGLVVPLTVRAGRVWQEARNYELALQELTNQLDQATSVDDQAREAQLKQWQPSAMLNQSLRGAKLEHEAIDDQDGGRRLMVTLRWDGLHEKSHISLVGWISPTKDSTGENK